MRILHYVVAIILAVSATMVLGGAANHGDMLLDLDGKVAWGNMVSVRYTKNGNELIGCGVRSFDNGDGTAWSFGFCQAADADDNYVICYTQQPELLDAIRGSADFSFLVFSWDGVLDPDFGSENGTCTHIGFSTQSFYLPKGLDNNEHVGNSGKSDK